MKKILLSLTISALILSSGFGQNNQANQKPDNMKFNKTVHDYGNIKYSSDDGIYDFVFENTSDKPIVLTNVKSSCGCTVPQWSKKPVMPGETSIIKVQYNTTIPGKFSKSVTVYSNAKNSPVKLQIKGNVTITMAETEMIRANNKRSQELNKSLPDSKIMAAKKQATKLKENEEVNKTGTATKGTFKKIPTTKKVGKEYKKINTTKKIIK